MGSIQLVFFWRSTAVHVALLVQRETGCISLVVESLTKRYVRPTAREGPRPFLGAQAVRRSVRVFYISRFLTSRSPLDGANSYSIQTVVVEVAHTSYSRIRLQ